jgi:hypothetical protein
MRGEMEVGEERRGGGSEGTRGGEVAERRERGGGLKGGYFIFA